MYLLIRVFYSMNRKGGQGREERRRGKLFSEREREREREKEKWVASIKDPARMKLSGGGGGGGGGC
jgi:hypothetical protein